MTEDSRKAEDSPETTTKISSTPSDPTGRVSVFKESSTPTIHEDVEKVYDYVDKKARSIGEKIRKNRGVPPQADPKNMMSVEEKALVILGRAIGVTWQEIMDRIVKYRQSRGKEPPDRDPYSLSRNIFRSHRPIISAIQADMVASLEAFSPLVNGAQRMVWRARIMEFCRREIERLAATPHVDDEQLDRIKKLDTMMRQHMSWFEDIGSTRTSRSS